MMICEVGNKGEEIDGMDELTVLIMEKVAAFFVENLFFVGASRLTE